MTRSQVVVYPLKMCTQFGVYIVGVTYTFCFKQTFWYDFQPQIEEIDLSTVMKYVEINLQYRSTILI